MMYTIYSQEGSEQASAIFVKDGFSMHAFLFSSLWFFYHKMWVWGLGLFVMSVFLKALCVTSGNSWSFIAFFMLSLFCGIFGNDLRQMKLSNGGYKFVSAVVAHDITEARVKFYNSMDQICSREY